jgi:outer membrane protein
MRVARSNHQFAACRSLAVAIALSLGASLTHAQSETWTHPIGPTINTPEHRTYSLQDLIQLALETNPKNREVQEQALQADLGVKLVKSQYEPQLDLKALAGNEYTPLAITRNVSPRGYIVTSSREVIPALELKWLLFDFGRRKGQVEAAKQNSRAVDSSLLGEQEKLVYDVSKAYFETTSSRGKVQAAQKALGAAKLTEEAITDQRRNGRATVVQVAEAHRQTAAAQVALTKASGDADTAFATLVATIGLPPESHFELTPPKDPNVSADDLPTLKSLIDAAMELRPDIAAARSKVAAAAAQVDVAHAAYHPTISLEAQVFQNIGKVSSDGSPYSTINLTGNSVFVAFELPLFDGGSRATHLSVAISEQAQAEDALADAKNTATQQVVESYSALKTSIDNRAQALAYTRAAELAYEASLDSFKHGLSSVNDLTNDEAALAQAEASQEDANADVLIAQAAVALAIGQHLPE